MDRFGHFGAVVGMLAMALIIQLVSTAPGIPSASLEAASLQLGALQSQAQYAPSALQGARKASRSAASCLVTAVQYTHGQQIWRADPCEFCLCLDGEMFCWWQECPPEAPGPCPSGQPYSLCGNSSSSSLDNRPSPVLHKPKKVFKKTTIALETTTPKTSKSTKPLSAPMNGTAQPNATRIETMSYVGKAKAKLSKSEKKYKAEAVVYSSTIIYQSSTASPSDDREHSTQQEEELNTSRKFGDDSRPPEKNGATTTSSTTTLAPAVSTAACLVMGTEYQIGEALPSTGSCLACRCSEGNNGAKVSCAPRGCAPLETLTDDPESF